MYSPATLHKIAEFTQIDNHYVASVHLAYIFRKLKINKLVFFCHEKGISQGVLKSITFRGKKIEFLILDDGCICAATYYQTLPSFSLRLITAAEFIVQHNKTQRYLKYFSTHGYFIDKDISEYVLRWVPIFDKFLPEYKNRNLHHRPLARLAINKRIFPANSNQ